MSIGFIGTGAMGLQIVLQLKAAGFAPHALDRSDRLREELTASGIRSSSSLKEVVEASEVVYICVLTDQQVKDVAFAQDGVIAMMPAGGVIIVHTTCDPSTLEELAREAAMKGIRVVDAALSGGPLDIAAGRLTLFIGSTPEDLEAVRPMLSSYSRVIVHAGPVGFGQRVKLVNNALFTAHIGLAADALRLGSALGVRTDVLLAALPHASGNSRAVQMIAATGSLEQTAASAGTFVAKDVRVVQEVAARLGADLGLLGKVLDSPFIQQEILDRH